METKIGCDTAYFIKKGTFSVHSFKDDYIYLSLIAQVGKSTFFHAIPSMQTSPTLVFRIVFTLYKNISGKAALGQISVQGDQEIYITEKWFYKTNYSGHAEYFLHFV